MPKLLDTELTWQTSEDGHDHVALLPNCSLRVHEYVDYATGRPDVLWEVNIIKQRGYARSLEAAKDEAVKTLRAFVAYLSAEKEN